MIKNYFVFTKEIGQLLIKCRKQARLSQGEVAKRCGLHTKTGYSQISRLESGRIKNPSLASIILFLKACNTPLVSFFQELSAIDFKIEHKNIMRQVQMPSGLTTDQRQKIDRDTAKYVNKIQYPKTPFQRLDWERIKTKIDKKVKVLLFNHELKEDMKTPYFQFTNQLIDNYDTGQITEIFKRYWQAKILRRGIINEIKSIVYKTFRYEQKRLEKPKPLTKEKLQKMGTGFLRYRVKIEPIEAKVQKKLGELNVPIAYNQAYKDFIRECYSALKKYYRKNPLLLTQRFAEIMKSWQAQGLKEEVLLTIKDIIIAHFEPPKQEK
jgi:transcriptional regulator with XRE-family HTH domain